MTKISDMFVIVTKVPRSIRSGAVVGFHTQIVPSLLAEVAASTWLRRLYRHAIPYRNVRDFTAHLIYYEIDCKSYI